MSRTRLAAAGIAVAAGLVLMLWLRPSPEGRVVSEPATPPAAAAAPAPSAAPLVVQGADFPIAPAAPASPTESPAERLARARAKLAESSLRETEPDGAVTLAADGSLRYDRALRRLFDYWLSLVGELSHADIRALVEAWLTERHPPRVVAQALDAYDRYLRYLAEVDRVGASVGSADPAQRLALLKQLRRQQLGAELATAFFAEQEAYEDWSLARWQLSRDPALSEAERESRMAAIEATLPDALRADLQSQRRTEAEVSLSQRIDEELTDPAARAAARRDAFDPETAARLDQLDVERQQWAERLAAYRGFLKTLEGLDATTREQRRAAYLGQHFAPHEAQRIGALEAVGQLEAADGG
jgi:lipase chaperone LimK